MKAKKGGKNKKAGSVDVTFVARQLGNPPKGQEQEAEGDSEEVIKAKRYKALALLKEEDHLWTLEQYAMVVRDTREKNYALQEQLIALEQNFDDNIQARQRRILELESAHSATLDELASLNVTLESERSANRRAAMEAERNMKRITEDNKQELSHLKSELQGLRHFQGERAQLEAELERQQKLREDQAKEFEEKLLESHRVLQQEIASKECLIEDVIAERSRNLRAEVMQDFAKDYTRVLEERSQANCTIQLLSDQVQELLKAINKSELVRSNLRRELEMAKDMRLRSCGLIKFYMNLVKKLQERGASDEQLISCKEFCDNSAQARVHTAPSSSSSLPSERANPRSLSAPPARARGCTKPAPAPSQPQEGEALNAWREVASGLDVFLRARKCREPSKIASPPPVHFNRAFRRGRGSPRRPTTGGDSHLALRETLYRDLTSMHEIVKANSGSRAYSAPSRRKFLARASRVKKPIQQSASFRRDVVITVPCSPCCPERRVLSQHA